MNARSIPSQDDQQNVQEELEQVVARIRARGAGVVLPRPDPEAMRQFIEHLRDEVPMSEEELRAHERMWRHAEEDMRAIDKADELADRRL